MDLNRAMIIGNVTRDPEVRTTTTGQNVASFGVATTHRWTDNTGNKQEKTEFHNIVAWGKLAEICGQYLGKGRKVYVEGRLQTREWDGQDGNRRQRTEIVAENMIMLERGAPGAPAAQFAGGQLAGGQQGYARQAAPAMAAAPMQPSRGGDDEIRIEDIPF
jgi:single-strand DNA-binding protein